jgi:hypothetical protein
MKKVLHKLFSALALILVLASCEDLTGLQGLPGENGTDGTNGANGIDGTNGTDGLDAPLPPDIEAILSAALEAKTGGGDEPWTVKVIGLDLSDSYTARHIFHGVAAGIDEGDIALDLSECSGEFYGYNPGISLKDRARYTGLTLPDSLTHISDGTEAYGAFAGFARLKGISSAGLLRVGDYAFFGLAAMETLDLPQVTVIGKVAFAPNSNTGTGSYIVNNIALKKVYLPRVETIGDRAFFRCIAIAELDLPEVLRIGNGAFWAYSDAPNTVLETVALPKAEFLDISAFRNCPAIKTINLPNAGQIYGYAFGNTEENPNTVLESVALPEAGILDGRIFYYCTALTSVDIPLALSIPNSLFDSCPALTTVNAPDLTSIGASAFANCAALTAETLDFSKITSVGDYAFDVCTGLTALELPSVTSFGLAPFRNCANLATLKLGPSVPAITASSDDARRIFSSAGSGTLTVYVPTDSGTAYSGAGWVNTPANGNVSMWGSNHIEIKIETY